MYTSPFSDDWRLGTLYKISLNKGYMGAALHGFRGSDCSQKRRFNSQVALDEYIGELWLRGFDDVTVERIDEDDDES